MTRKYGGYPMKIVVRKLKLLVLLVVSVSFLSTCAVPDSQQSNQGTETQAIKTCPNCGMMLKKWVHTNHEFRISEGRFRTCSIHCLVDTSTKSGEEPKEVQVALHLVPEKMIPAKGAFYVVGSSAPGTMTMVSKLAFPSQMEAETFVSEKGGKIRSFSEAFMIAKAELPKMKPKIEAKRKRRGKIVEPSEQDRCGVCNMLPVRYPKHNAQLITAQKKRVQFCSTKCLFKFLEDPEGHGAAGVGIGPVWVHDYASGRFIFGKNAYYVVGSKVLGPMGHEAIPFDMKSDGMKFARENGGRVLKFNGVTLAKIESR
jgi:nitrous oxide reductase accessory protein NosL